MNHLRSNKNIGKTKGARSRTHGSDSKARPVTNHDGKRKIGVWGSDRREDTGMWGGVEGGTRVGDPLGADRRRPPHGAEGLREQGSSSGGDRLPAEGVGCERRGRGGHPKYRPRGGEGGSGPHGVPGCNGLR